LDKNCFLCENDQSAEYHDLFSSYKATVYKGVKILLDYISFFLACIQTTSVDEAQRLQRRFVREMSLCFSDLQSLVQILVQQAEGKDPNVSLLLGTRGEENFGLDFNSALLFSTSNQHKNAI